MLSRIRTSKIKKQLVKDMVPVEGLYQMFRGCLFMAYTVIVENNVCNMWSLGFRALRK